MQLMIINVKDPKINEQMYILCIILNEEAIFKVSFPAKKENTNAEIKDGMASEAISSFGIPLSIRINWLTVEKNVIGSSDEMINFIYVQIFRFLMNFGKTLTTSKTEVKSAGM